MKKALSIILLLATILSAAAHPMPNSLVDLKITPKMLVFEIHVPLSDFETAFGEKVDLASPEKLAAYFSQHLRMESADGGFWKLDFGSAEIVETSDAFIGKYAELRAILTAEPPTEATDLRKFTLFYDIVLHQIVTHQAIIHIKQDWENGIHDGYKELAVAKMDIETGKIYPILVNIEIGSAWKGMKTMLELGMSHIAEGMDHLLFLLMLLLVAPLKTAGKKWAGFGGLRYSWLRLLKMVTAFTLGHSLTLAVCSLGWVRFSNQWIEVAIAVSILVSAVHAIFPLFFGKEVLVAAAFGLIHGMAFSNTISNLHLDKTQLVLSIFGFNVGIELMQLFIVVCSVPFLILLSKSRFYGWFRNGAAVFGMIAAAGWIVQRITNLDNPITRILENLTE